MAHESSLSQRATPNFDRLASRYRWLEYLTFGPLLQRARMHFAAGASRCRRALVLGDGDGRFTAALLALHPCLDVHAVDGSPAMLQALRHRCRKDAERLTTEQADLRLWSPSPGAGYDLIATHFFLDCLTTAEVSDLAQRLTPAVTPGAPWIVSDFAVPSSRFGRLIAAPLIAGLYLAFRLLTGLRTHRLPNHGMALCTAKWTMQAQASRLNGLLISQLWRKEAASCILSGGPFVRREEAGIPGAQ